MVNRCALLGRLGKDPEVQALPSGQSVCKFSIATDDSYTKNGERQKITDWHNIVVFGKSADACGYYLQKGSMAYVEGKIKTRSYEAKDGSGKRYTTEIVASMVKFIGGVQRDGQGGGGELIPEDSDEIPF